MTFFHILIFSFCSLASLKHSSVADNILIIASSRALLQPTFFSSPPMVCLWLLFFFFFFLISHSVPCLLACLLFEWRIFDSVTQRTALRVPKPLVLRSLPETQWRVFVALVWLVGFWLHGLVSLHRSAESLFSITC